MSSGDQKTHVGDLNEIKKKTKKIQTLTRQCCSKWLVCDGELSISVAIIQIFTLIEYSLAYTQFTA